MNHYSNCKCDICKDLRTCIKCNHRACPFCINWCDVVLEDFSLCCDGACTYKIG